MPQFCCCLSDIDIHIRTPYINIYNILGIIVNPPPYPRAATQLLHQPVKASFPFCCAVLSPCPGMTYGRFDLSPAAQKHPDIIQISRFQDPATADPGVAESIDHKSPIQHMGQCLVPACHGDRLPGEHIHDEAGAQPYSGLGTTFGLLDMLSYRGTVYC